MTDTSANDIVKRAVVDYLQAHGHTDMVRAAFDKALDRHRIAFDKLVQRECRITSYAQVELSPSLILAPGKIL